MSEETHQKSSQHGSALLGFIIIIATAFGIYSCSTHSLRSSNPTNDKSTQQAAPGTVPTDIATRKHAPKNGECAVKIARLALEHGGEFLWWGEETFDTQNDDGGRNLQGNIYWQQDGEMKTRAHTCDIDSAGLLKRSSWLGDK